MRDIDRIQLIQKKRRNRLGADKQAYDDLYTQDPSFQNEVEDYDLIFDGLDMLHLDEVKQNLSSWEAKHQKAAPAKIIPLRKFYMYAAAAVVALVFSLSFLFTDMFNNDPLAGHFKAEQYSYIAIVGESVRTGNHTLTEADELKSAAFAAFDNKEYASCIEILEGYINNHTDLQAILVMSIAQLELGDAASASRNLEVVLSAPKHPNQATAQWIMALAQYKLGNTDACKKFLNSIVGQKGHEYTENAKKLLEELE